MKIANVLYGTALILMPVSYAVKSLLGLEDMVWINPSLILAAVVLLLLIPRWGDFLNRDLLPVLLCSIGIGIAVIPAAISGLVLRPTPLPYDVLREPIRLYLLLIWLLTSCWFLRYNRRMVFRCTAIAAMFALLTGFYMYGVVVNWLPANMATVSYARIYFLRQAIWLYRFPVPRMGGLFVEAPPFGLFMFSSAIVLLVGRYLGEDSRLLRWGFRVAIFGTILSLTDQVILGGAIALAMALPTRLNRNRWYFWPVLVIVLSVPTMFLAGSFLAKTGQSDGEPSAIYINGSSVGERSFHSHYGISLLTADAKRVPFGIGPGRYGEYAAETGLYPGTVTMQFTAMEILCEWGVVGLAVLGGCVIVFLLSLWRTSGFFGTGLFAGLLLANSFQSNWKWEGAFLAVATLYTSIFVKKKLPDVRRVEVYSEV
jgi:hypothetical protein